jgi:type III pantothenate kinase
MLLTLDIGNTNIKSALFNGNQISDFIVHSSISEALTYIAKISFNFVAICSVNHLFEEKIQSYFSRTGISFFRVNIESIFNLSIRYETPNSLGMDRICSAIGALDIATKENLLSNNQYLITLDFGTATTINIISPSKEFIGGLIAPGINTMVKSLNEKTAQLPLPKMDSYSGLIGNSTNSSIISGVINSAIGLINEAVNYLYDISRIPPLVFATGGNAGYILPHLKVKASFEEVLVLKGLKIVYELNKGDTI